MNGNRLAQNVMMWLGIVYMFVAVIMMTPYTHQLDDIKVTLIHIMGPILIVAYLAFLGLGYLEIPRRGIWIPLAVYFGVLALAALFTEPFARWQAWLGFWMQWVLLGPFLAFFASCQEKTRLRKVMLAFMLLTFICSGFGLAHRGVKDVQRENGKTVRSRSGIATWVVNHYREPFQELLKQRSRRIDEFEQLEQEYRQSQDPAVKAQLQKRLREVHGVVQQQTRRAMAMEKQLSDSVLYKLAATFDSRGAQNTMLSLILNRSFFAAFLLMQIPIAIGVFLFTGGWFRRMLEARDSKSRWRSVLSVSFLWQLIAFITIVMSLIALIHTRSKISIYLGIEAGLFMLAVLYFFVARNTVQRRLKWFLIVVGSALLLAPLTLLFSEGVSFLKLLNPDEMQDFVNNFIVSFTSRFIIWKGGLEAWLAHPLIGNGSMTFGIMFPFHRLPYYYLFEISHRTIFSHNFFLDLLSESGILGFGAFMTFLGFLYVKTLQLIRHDPDGEKNVMALCVLAGLTGFLLNNVVSPNSRWPIGAISLWSSLGIVAGLINRPRRPESDHERSEGIAPSNRQRKLAWALCGLSVIAGIYTSNYGVRYFKGSMANNVGLQLTGEIGGTQTVTQYRQQLINARNRLQRGNLSGQALEQAKAQVAQLEAEFESVRSKAADAFREAIRLNPYFTTSYYKLATLEFQGPRMQASTEDYERALRTYKRLQAMGPEYSQVRLNLASCYQNLNEPFKALDNYERAAEMTIDLEILKIYLGFVNRLAMISGWPEMAPEEILQPVRLAKKLQKGKSPLEQYLWKKLKPETQKSADAVSIKEAEKARELAEEAQEYRMKADANPRRENHWKAKAKEKEEKEAPLHEKINALRNQLADDLNAVLRGPSIYEEERFAGVNLSKQTQLWLEDKVRITDTKAVFLNRSLLEDAFPKAVKNNMRETATRHTLQAMKYWEILIDNDMPIRPSEYAKRDEILKEAAGYYVSTAEYGPFAQRIEALKKFLEIDPEEKRITDRLFELYLRQGALEEMAQYLQEQIDIFPEKPSLWQWQARLNLERGKLREAKKSALMLEKLHPRADALNWLFYKIYEAAEKPELAIPYAQKYVQEGDELKWKNEARRFLKKHDAMPEDQTSEAGA